MFPIYVHSDSNSLRTEQNGWFATTVQFPFLDGNRFKSSDVEWGISRGKVEGPGAQSAELQKKLLYFSGLSSVFICFVSVAAWVQ